MAYQKNKREYIARIIDGDTIKTRSGKTVRLLGYNAPEKGQYGSKAATNFLQKLLPIGSFATMEFKGKDQYGRWLATVSNWNTNINSFMKWFLRKIFG